MAKRLIPRAGLPDIERKCRLLRFGQPTGKSGGNVLAQANLMEARPMTSFRSTARPSPRYDRRYGGGPLLVREAETAYRDAVARHGVNSAEALVALWHWKQLRQRAAAAC